MHYTLKLASNSSAWRILRKQQKLEGKTSPNLDETQNNFKGILRDGVRPEDNIKKHKLEEQFQRRIIDPGVFLQILRSGLCEISI